LSRHLTEWRAKLLRLRLHARIHKAYEPKPQTPLPSTVMTKSRETLPERVWRYKLKMREKTLVNWGFIANTLGQLWARERRMRRVLAGWRGIARRKKVGAERLARVMNYTWFSRKISEGYDKVVKAAQSELY